MILSGADIVMETLLEQGARTIFGYPGGQAIDLYDALYKVSDRLEHILSSHEQHATHAADGYARSSGDVGVVIATSGPGATNLVTGIATAYLDSIPMVAITGNVPHSLIGRDSFQEVDIAGITLPITKHNFVVHDVTQLADTIREAFRIAKSGRPGPVLIDIPKDIQQATCEFVKEEPVKAEPIATISQAKLEQALKLIEESEKPYIYIGGGVISSGVEKQVLDLANLIDAPIGSSLMGLSAISTDNPRFLGMQGMHGHFASSRAQADADLIIALGVRFSDRATGNTAKFATKTKIIHFDVDPAEINKNVQVDLALKGDLKNGLERMLERLPHMEHPEWSEHIRKLKKQERAQFEHVTPKDELTPFAIINEVSKYADEKTPIVTDVGQHQMWVAQFFPFKTPRTFISSGGLGTMGYGLGAAIGASKATGKRTILFTGDGSFGMNLNELATLKANKIPVVIIVMNNKVLGMVRQWQNLFYNQHFSHTNLDDRESDFAAIARAFGIPAETIRNKDEMAAKVAWAFAKDGPVLLDVAIDRDEFVLPMLPPGGSMDDIITEKEEA